MKTKEFLDHLDDTQITAAIRAAESRTSGEIRVFVTNRPLGGTDVFDVATRQFEKLGMTATADRNGVLLFLAPRDQRFAILGDHGINEKCGPNFWNTIASDLRRELAEHHFTPAVVSAIHRAGEALAAHFPRALDDLNELPDSVERD